MRVIRTVKDLDDWRKSVKGKVGFVPTMGFLHQGHLSLVDAAKKECDLVVVSIFVNPAQFNDGTDFESYPRDEVNDLDLLKERVVDVCFMPEVSDVYPDGAVKIEMKVPDLTSCLCGKYRPGHFEGVLLVVSKLFNFVRPDVVYFGQKDFQQCLVVKQLIRDLNFRIEMRIEPTVRSEEGLALSSRNARLSEDGLKKALLIKDSLDMVVTMIEDGENSIDQIEEALGNFFVQNGVEVEYAEMRSAVDLSRREDLGKPLVYAVAVWIEGVRLIDNVVIS